MQNIKNWLSETKISKPGLKDFILEIENHFHEGGFNANDHEKTVETKLNSFEDEVRKSLTTDPDAEDKKINN